MLDGGSQAADTTQTTSDIRLITFDNTGAAGQDLPDSISQVTADSAVSITSNFRFVKGAETIDDLSILWVERDAEIDTSLFENDSSTSQPGDSTTGAGDENIDLSEIKYNERDVLKSVKFYTQDGSIRFTGALDVADMADAEQEGGTLIDHFDAYVSSAETNQLKAVILGTTYGAPTATSSNGLVTKSVLLADNETVAEVTVPTSVTNMYTATGSYADQISVSAVLADYDTIRLGANIQIQFTVKNEGIHAVDSLTIRLTDPDGTSYTTEHKFEEGSLLLPGQTISVYADYRVPESGVVDPAYTVEAAFSHDGASGTAVTQRTISMGLLSETTDLTQVTGSTIYLNLPDVEITEAKVVNEEEGKRTVQIKLNNHADAALIEGENAVKLSFYSDATCETPLEVSYGGQGKVVESITITDQLDLDMMNEGGYAVQVTFDVGEFVKGEDGTTQEIPESGITVYLKAEVLGPARRGGRRRRHRPGGPEHHPGGPGRAHRL